MDSFSMGGMGQVNTLMPINKNTFCVAPWFSLYVNANKKISPCCKFKSINYEYNEIQKYWKSGQIKKVRQDLLDGVKNHNCAKCWKDEQNGGDSLRLISNRTIGRATDISILEQVKNPKLSNLKSFDLILGNLCNLKCVMCNPGLSSRLLAEVNLNEELKENFKGQYNQKDYDWPNHDEFVSWCNKYLPQSIHIKFTGGEPFIIPWIQTVIDKIPDEQKKKCILNFTTNLTNVNLKLFENFRKFKEVWISVSAEGTNETHEYLRYGHKWETLQKNITAIQDMKIPNLILKINHVVQTASYHSIIAMTKYFDQIKVEIHPILLTNPKHFHISSLTKRAKQQFIDDTLDYKGHNRDFINFVRSASAEYIEQDTSSTKKCIEYLSRFDKIRKNSHKDIIPSENISY
jgi:MoaA/NifB/PqqE/SkfB family radical SAM enzyme